MAIVICVGRNENDKNQYTWFINDWKQALLALDPKLDIRVYPDVGDQKDIDLVLVWNHPFGIFTQFTHLKAIASLAAGVDHLLQDPDLPRHVPIVRVVDNYMANDIVQYVAACVLNYVRRMDHWKAKQQACLWAKEPPFTLAEKMIGIMGLGFLGGKVAYILQEMGLRVSGWSRTEKNIKGLSHFVGQSKFIDFLSQTDILISMLPLTKETKNILNKEVFAYLPWGAYLINVGRGDQLVEEDLLSALDSGQLSGASLDVFRHEPLPQAHPFWLHPKIRVTPHIASVTNAVTAAPQVLENYRRVLMDEPSLHLVDVVKGY